MKRSIVVSCGLLVTLVSSGQVSSLSKLDSAIIVGDKIIETDTREFFRNVESMIVYSKGAVKFEKYYNGFVRDSLHHIQSQTKSIVALLMGIAIDMGFVKSEDELVAKFYPDFSGNGDELKSRIRIRDLLTMSSGFRWEEMLPLTDPKNDNMNMYRSGKWLNYALERPMVTEPFTGFKYNSGCPMIVAGIIEKSSKMTLDDFAKKFLFDPLGIKDYYWLKDSSGFCHAGGGLYMRPLDMLKIGVLVLNKGKWEDRQIISQGWIQKATLSYFPTSFDISSYGYFWWIREMKIREGKTTKMISAEGAGGQNLYIIPEYGLVIGFTERNYRTPQVGPLFIKESVLKALD